MCGNTTSTAGLTVTLTKETGSGDFALEAGALVLADQGRDNVTTVMFTCLFVCLLFTGCCCIDEFDKMGTKHHALLEAMVS